MEQLLTCRSPCHAVQRADEIAQEKNRALKAALNADMRKTKATLLEQAIPLLEKMAKKGKGVPPEKVQARQAQVRACLTPCITRQHAASVPVLTPHQSLGQVAELKQTIEEISDGVHSARKPQKPFSNGGAKSGEVTISNLDMDGRYQAADYYTHTEQTKAFQQVCRQGLADGRRVVSRGSQRLRAPPRRP